VLRRVVRRRDLSSFNFTFSYVSPSPPCPAARHPLTELSYVNSIRTPPRNRRRVLIFNYSSDRSGETLLSAILNGIMLRLDEKSSSAIDAEDTKHFFDHAIFCTNTTYSHGSKTGKQSRPLTFSI
jgi:hypothetical protein